MAKRRCQHLFMAKPFCRDITQVLGPTQARAA
jgi:hypothetical protein